MKKILTASLLALSMTAMAADYVSVDVEKVKDRNTQAESQTQYLRVSKDAYGLNFGLQMRTAVANAGGMLNSVEGTVGRNFNGITPFFGVGHDNGFNGAKGGAYQYGLVGASAGTNLGKFYGFAGVKTRVNWDNASPKQTVAFTGLTYPIAKNASVNLNYSRSFQDIDENAFGFGVTIGF
jgi:hypothetical protein